MFIQTENTPNPNSLKFLPGRKVSNNGPLEAVSYTHLTLPTTPYV